MSFQPSPLPLFAASLSAFVAYTNHQSLTHWVNWWLQTYSTQHPRTVNLQLTQLLLQLQKLSLNLFIAHKKTVVGLVTPVLLNFTYKADSVYLVPSPLRQRFNMFILSCCWQAPQHVSPSVYTNAGKELICILSVCFCVRGHLFARYITAKTDISWGLLAHHWLLNLIWSNFSNKASSVQFLCLTPH